VVRLYFACVALAFLTNFRPVRSNSVEKGAVLPLHACSHLQLAHKHRFKMGDYGEIQWFPMWLGRAAPSVEPPQHLHSDAPALSPRRDFPTNSSPHTSSHPIYQGYTLNDIAPFEAAAFNMAPVRTFTSSVTLRFFSYRPSSRYCAFTLSIIIAYTFSFITLSFEDAERAAEENIARN
jgi:hypothetical protein